MCARLRLLSVICVVLHCSSLSFLWCFYVASSRSHVEQLVIVLFNVGNCVCCLWLLSFRDLSAALMSCIITYLNLRRYTVNISISLCFEPNIGKNTSSFCHWDEHAVVVEVLYEWELLSTWFTKWCFVRMCAIAGAFLMHSYLQYITTLKARHDLCLKCR